MKLKFKNKADAALFKLGQPMWSPDNGVTWYRGEPPKSKGPADFVVTKVDRQRGVVTIGPVK